MKALVAAIRQLVEAAAVRHVLPGDRAAGDRFARCWRAFRWSYPGLRSGRVEAIVSEHALVWVAQGRTGAIRRAKRAASDWRTRETVRAMLAVVAPVQPTVVVLPEPTRVFESTGEVL